MAPLRACSSVLAPSVLDSVGDQLGGDQAERDGGGGRQPGFDTLDHDALVAAVFRGQHGRIVVAQLVDESLEGDDCHAVEGMQAAVDAGDRGHAVGGGREVRRGPGIGLAAALQREQAHDHLQAVHQAMVGFPAQYLAMVEELVLLVQQGLLARQGPAQPDFRAATLGELVLVAGGRTLP